MCSCDSFCLTLIYFTDKTTLSVDTDYDDARNNTFKSV